jgi:hypothetical protein
VDLVEKLSADNFFDKLQQGTLETAIPFSIIGMVKRSEGKEKAIEFAPGGNCSNWVRIPLELIEDVEILKTVSCKDHSHPLAKLNMKTPKTAEGKVLFGILEGMKSGAAKAEPSSRSSNSGYQSSRPQPSRRTVSRRAIGMGGFGGYGGYNDIYNCRDEEYQCVCVEWEHVGFGMDVCVRQECKFVCIEAEY